jgi:hypothetical protein
MKIFQERVERRQTGTTCDMCGKECDGWEAYGWIFSHADTTCEFCEDCYNKVVKAIEDMGGKFHPVELP